MNPGSYYLYEYESCCRRRNLGFLQISSHNYSYLLTLHVKNLPIVPGEQLEVHAFILENQTLIGSPVALLHHGLTICKITMTKTTIMTI